MLTTVITEIFTGTKYLNGENQSHNLIVFVNQIVNCCLSLQVVVEHVTVVGMETLAEILIRFRFNEKKTTAVTALLLKLNGGAINSAKLLKLLYLTDREALLRWRRPLTGDDYVSTSNGPVLRVVPQSTVVARI